MSQTDLSKKSGLSQGQISRYESGTNEPTAEYLTCIAKALECSTDYLLGLTEDTKPITGDSGLDNGEIELLRLYRSKSADSQHKLLDIARVL